MKQSILIVLMALTLTACSSIPNVFNIESAPIEKPTLVLPTVDTFNQRDVEWIVVTPENVNNIFKDLEDSNTDVVLFALTDNGYSNLTLNFADIIKLLQQQKAIIAAYKQYYESQQ